MRNVRLTEKCESGFPQSTHYSQAAACYLAVIGSAHSVRMWFAPFVAATTPTHTKLALHQRALEFYGNKSLCAGGPWVLRCRRRIRSAAPKGLVIASLLMHLFFSSPSRHTAPADGVHFIVVIKFYSATTARWRKLWRWAFLLHTYRQSSKNIIARLERAQLI